MKAKEYVAQYKAEGETPEALQKMLHMLFYEFNTLAGIRQAMSHPGWASILEELNQKWKSIVFDINADQGAFVEYVKGRHGILFSIWMNHYPKKEVKSVLQS
ncbi:MAG: hypothetical protein AAB587_00735 [Patescibacteria group bacterium]